MQNILQKIKLSHLMQVSYVPKSSTTLFLIWTHFYSYMEIVLEAQ